MFHSLTEPDNGWRVLWNILSALFISVQGSFLLLLGKPHLACREIVCSAKETRCEQRNCIHGELSAGQCCLKCLNCPQGNLGSSSLLFLYQIFKRTIYFKNQAESNSHLLHEQSQLSFIRNLYIHEFTLESSVHAQTFETNFFNFQFSIVWILESLLRVLSKRSQKVVQNTQDTNNLGSFFAAEVSARIALVRIRSRPCVLRARAFADPRYELSYLLRTS